MSQTVARTYYRSGLVFKAHEKAQGHEECCRSHKNIYAADGTVIDEIRALWAEFGVYGNQYTYTDPLTDRTETGSEFWGGYFDLDAQAETKDWTGEEKEIVARHLIRLIETKPGWAQFSLYSKAPVGRPWPKYDDAHHNQIPVLAEQLGLVGEALAYEQENKNRESVVEKLREALATAQSVGAEELTAA